MIAKLAQTLNSGRRPRAHARAFPAPANDNRTMRALARRGGKRRLACRWHVDASGRLACRWALEEAAEDPGQQRRQRLSRQQRRGRARRLEPSTRRRGVIIPV
jgi:hypothetical protein